MPISNNRTSADFTFTHEGKPDEYGVTVTSDELKRNFDSRAVDNLNDINALKDALRSTEPGADGADAIGWQHTDASFGSTVASALREIISVGSYNNLADKKIKIANLDEGIGAIPYQILSTNGNDYGLYPVGISYSILEDANYIQTGQSDNTDFPQKGILITFKGTATRTFQLLLTSSGQVLTRYYYDTEGWHSWNVLATEDYVIDQSNHTYYVESTGGNYEPWYRYGISCSEINDSNRVQSAGSGQTDLTDFPCKGTLLTVKFSRYRFSQILWSSEGTEIYQRTCYNDVWSEWCEMGGGTVIKNPTVAAGVVAGDTVILNTTGTQWEEAGEIGIGIYDGSDIVPFGSVIEIPGATFNVGYNHYRQDNGNISTQITNDILGFAISGSELIMHRTIGIGRTVAYTGLMQDVTGMPRLSGTFHATGIKAKKPSEADGFEIRRSTVGPYNGEGRLNWGTPVSTISDDSLSYGDDVWYIDDNAGLGLGLLTNYWYYIFPFIGTTFNEAVVTEHGFKIQLFDAHREWTGNVIEGSLVKSTFDNDTHLPMENIAVQSGEVGRKLYFNGTNARLYLGTKWLYGVEEDMSWTMRINTGPLTSTLCLLTDSYYSGGYGRGLSVDIIPSGSVRLRTNDGSATGHTWATYSVAAGLQPNTTYTLGLRINVNGHIDFHVYVDGVLAGGVDNQTNKVPSFNSSCRFAFGHCALYSGGLYSGEFTLEQIRCWLGDIGAENHKLIHNGGNVV